MRDDVREIPIVAAQRQDLLAERGIDISHGTDRFWWNRFAPMFAAEIRKKCCARRAASSSGVGISDEAFVKINGKLCHLWRRGRP